MVSKPKTWLISAIFLIILQNSNKALGGDVGITYGRFGNNVPTPAAVANFLANDLDYSISLIRVPDANPEVLAALSRTNLVVTIGVPNEDVAILAQSKYNAINWVNLRLKPCRLGLRIRYVTVGDGLIPRDPASALLVLPAMRNLRDALGFLGFSSDIHVTTVVPINALCKSYPPSSGEFDPSVSGIMRDITSFLYSVDSPLMIAVYPYFSLVSEPEHITLDYALFRSKTPVVRDAGYEYYNLFDAMVDAFGAAVAKVSGKEDVKIVVGGTGWPTDGKLPYSCVENARVYNNNLKKHARGIGRTPRLGHINLEAYIYDMFDEDLNPDSGLRGFGMFYPNLTEVYPMWR